MFLIFAVDFLRINGKIDSGVSAGARAGLRSVCHGNAISPLRFPPSSEEEFRMNQDRFAGFFDSRRPEDGNQTGQPSLRGFTTNPLGETITPAQALMYHAAYQHAQKDLQEPEWPEAECWN
jgi:hypothetical protein